MKKLICICFSLILLLLCAGPCFAEVYIYSPDGELLDGNTGASSTKIQLESSCYYDKLSKRFVYSTDISPNANVESSVYSGMMVRDAVELTIDPSANVEVYRDGLLVDPSEYTYLEVPGSYVVRNITTDREVLSFTIVSEITGAVNSYKLPSIFYYSSASYEGEPIPTDFNSVSFDKDGWYTLTYRSTIIDADYSLGVEIDHTYPELEIYGVENDVANGPVSFGPTESGSSLNITLNGEPFEYYKDDILKQAGEYVVKYTDRAGNTSSYYFTINIFLDGGAWIFVGMAAAIIIAAIVYIIYCKKHTRVR